MPTVNRSALVRHSARAMFDLVNDFERYPEFLSGCSNAELLERDEDHLKGRLTLSKAGMQQSFVTRNDLYAPERIELNLVDGSTADTVVNSKAVVYGAAGQITANELDVDNIQIDANAVKSTNTNGNIQLFPNGTGFTELYGNTNAGTIRFNCESNSHGVTLKGPPHSASATYTLELPNADGSDGQLLKTDGSGKLAFTSSLPGITATAAEINKLDGVTATTTELNYVDVTTLGLTEASKAVTADANGVVSFDNGTIDESTTITSSSNAATINLRDGNVFLHDLTENVTYTFSNPAASGRASAFVLKIIQDSSARTITWPGSVDWAAATAPTLTTTNNGVDIFVFLTIDGGTTYYGFTAGQAFG